jgi:putative DNA modification/repair radical SAM protein
MEDLIRVAKSLRQEHQFRGYIHLKTIPVAAPELLAEAGLYADRLSMNVEMPSDASLAALAPEKPAAEIKRGLALTRNHIDASAEPSSKSTPPPRYAPAGQSTQMVIGADRATDLDILRASSNLYASYALKRVYYSAFSPTGHASPLLPNSPTPLLREHRLYQADWLLRFYGFALPELEATLADGMLDATVDPKLAWALAHRDAFPVDINQARRESLLRVPGLGTRSVDRILAARRHGKLRLKDVARLTTSLARVRPFIVTPDWRPRDLLEDTTLRQRLARAPRQLALAL